MKRLFAMLNYDSGKVETVDISFENEWRDAFDYLVNVHCRTNDVELIPLRIEFCGMLDAKYDFESAEMVYVDDIMDIFDVN